MGENSKIEWTHHTFNAWWGCEHVHTGCKNCYAEMWASRFGISWGSRGVRRLAAESTWKQPLAWDRKAAKTGVRARVFCASMSDVFEGWSGHVTNNIGNVICRPYLESENIRENWNDCDAETLRRDPQGWSAITLDDVRRELFKLIDATPNLDWLLLTKRPENILRMWPARSDYEYVPEAGSLNEYPMHRRENVWLGTSISDQESANKQVPELLKCRELCPVLFVSAEPLLGPVDLRNCVTYSCGSTERSLNVMNGHSWESSYDGGGGIGISNRKLDWVIVGCESGPRRRPMQTEWAESLVDQCVSAGVPAFMKQMEISGRVSNESGLFPFPLDRREFPNVI